MKDILEFLSAVGYAVSLVGIGICIVAICIYSTTI